MRVAVVSHDTFWPLKGGGGIRVYWVVKNMISRDHRVTVIAPFLNTEGMPEDVGSVIPMSIGRITRFVSRKEWIYVCMICRVFFRLLFHRFDVIYAHNIVAAFPAVLIGRLKRIPVVFDMDDLLTGYSKNPAVYHLGPKLEQWAAKKAAVTIVPSSYTNQWCASRGIGNTLIVRHGVDLDLFKPAEAARKYIAFTGGIEVNDGVLLIPEAAEIILKHFPDIRFLLVGEGKAVGPLRKKVQELGLTSCFDIRGWTRQTDIPDLLARSYVGLITSLKASATEFSSPLRAYEYMAMALPYAASDLQGIAEQVRESRAGLLFQNGDSGALAKAVLTLLNDEKMRQSMGQNGRAFAEKYCDWRKNAGDIVAICEEAARPD